jgi:ankyrin repeat protein
MSGSTSFNEALWRGQMKVAGRALARLDPNQPDRWGRMPLAMAAQYGDAAIIAKLIARGADVEGGRTHLTPLAYATRRGQVDIVRVLREAGARPSTVSKIYQGKLARGAASIVDEEGTPLLHHAAQSLRAETVAALLDAGADVHQGDRFGETALHRVADLRRTDGPKAAAIALLLIDRGARVDARNRDQVSPLHQAVRARNLAVVEVLLARGADPNARDRRGSSVLARALSSTGAGGTRGIDPKPFVEILRAHGARR